MLTVKDIRLLIKDLPDDALVLQVDPHSEFSYDCIGIEKGFTKISHITNEGYTYYESFSEDSFEDLVADNPEDENELKNVYKPSLLIRLD